MYQFNHTSESDLVNFVFEVLNVLKIQFIDSRKKFIIKIKNKLKPLNIPLKKFENQIKIIDKSNSGESESVTIAFGEARGEFLIVVSADDPLLSEKLFEKSFDDFENDPQLVAIYPDWNMIGPEGEVLKTIKVPDYSDELLIGRCITLPGPGVIFRKSAALEIGGRRKKWIYVGDYDFWLRLSRIGELRQ